MPATEHQLGRLAGRGAVTAEPRPRLAILFDAANDRRGARRETIEALLDAWLGRPVTIDHRPDGSPFLPAAPDAHVSLSHATGATALALHDRSIGIDISEIEPVGADAAVAKELFSQAEQAWLSSLDADARPAGFAQLWTLKEAVLKCRRRGLGVEGLPDVSDFTPWLNPTGQPDRTLWQSWRGLEMATPRSPFRLLGGEQLMAEVASIGARRFAIASAWAREPV